jgi:hypothetical protein
MGVHLYTGRLLIFEIISSLHFLTHFRIQQIESKSLSRQGFRRDENYLRRSSQSFHRIRGRSLEGLKKSGDQRSCVSLKDRRHESR